MPAAPLSYRQYPGNGSAVLWPVPFGFLLRGHVHLYLGYNLLTGDFDSELQAGSGFQWESDTLVRTTSPVGAGSTLTIIRQTPTSDLLVQWQDGSDFTGEQLRLADLQTLYAAQEQSDITALSSSEVGGAVQAAEEASAAAMEAAAAAAAAASDAQGIAGDAEQALEQSEAAMLAAGQAASAAASVAGNASSAVQTAAAALQAAQAAVATANAAAIAVGQKANAAEVWSRNEADSRYMSANARPEGITNAELAFDGGALGARNALINGGFTIWQQGDIFVNPASNSYVADQWKVVWDGTGARTITRGDAGYGPTALPVEGAQFLRWSQTAAGSGASVNMLAQPVEFARTFAGRTVTLSFCARAAANTALQSVLLSQSFGTGGTPSAPVTTELGAGLLIGTAWQWLRLTATLPSLAGKVLGTNSDDALILQFRLPTNTLFTLDLGLVQLEEGATATPFERRPDAMERSLCQRYWQSGRAGLDVLEEADRLSRVMVNFRVPMRATPVVTQQAADQIEFSTDLHSSLVTVEGFFSGRIKNNLNGKGTWINSWQASARL